ncbi:hypothetical protein C1933_19315 [Stenotrophomonas sp. ZAC14D2_NAIMI4_6]|nr:hypothetical protein C1933_19315 [Stenotrophomonas sp. ZAC14D2_NAIMI4_6]
MPTKVGTYQSTRRALVKGSDPFPQERALTPRDRGVPTKVGTYQSTRRALVKGSDPFPQERALTPA